MFSPSRLGSRPFVLRRIWKQQRVASLSSVSADEIPQPPADSRSYEPPKDTHVEFFMANGGSAKLLDFQKALYNINDIVRYRFPGNEIVTMFDPEEM